MRWGVLIMAVVLLAGGLAYWVSWPKDCACLPMIEEDGVVSDAGVAATPDCLC
ncbi:hypothetical protein [Pseudophaeobacter sp.]|uniref:hypothetical protein n=1 Tax=Pseudophaeobacter sp. TaxID=1971739 RepID=UPI00329994ED